MFDVYKMVQAMAVSNKLSYTAVLDIIKFANVIIGHNVVPESEYIYKKVCNEKNDYERHYFCNDEKCVHYFGLLKNDEIKGTNCPKCSSLVKEYFIYKPIISSLKTIISENILDIIEHSDKLKKIPENVISDIKTGDWYKQNANFNDGNFFSININTD